MKIAICTFGCLSIPKYAEEILVIQQTWGKRAKEKGIIHYFFLGESDAFSDIPQPEEFAASTSNGFVFLKDVGNDYASASHKQNLGLKFIYEHHPEVDYIFCCGTDTFVNIDKMIWFLANFVTTPNKPLYIGGHYDHRTISGKEVLFYLGGGGFILNRLALDLLHPALEDMYEMWKSVCGHRDYVNACDLCIGYFCDIMKINTMTYWPYFLDCNYQGIKRDKVNVDAVYPCCYARVDYNRLVTCHEMRPNEMIDFSCILENNNYFMST